MIPNISTVEDIRTVMRQNRRWRRKQRILALRKCNKQLGILRMRGDISMEDAFKLRGPLLRMLKEEERLYVYKDGKNLDDLRTYRPAPVITNATDAAMELAEDRGINLLGVTGTGKDGRITVKDVRSVS